MTRPDPARVPDPRPAIPHRRLAHWWWLGAAVLPLLLIVAGVVPAGVGLFSILVAVYWLLWRIRPHAATLLLVCLSVAALGTVLDRPWLNVAASDVAADDGAARVAEWAATGGFDDRLPVVLHIVFDELMSPGGIDPALPGGATTRDAMHQMASAHDLRLYDSIYSRFYYSAVSLPNLMDGEYAGHTVQSELQNKIGNTSADSAYFADMAHRGYRSVVFQTSVLNFCAPPSVSLCETFPSYDPGVVSGGGLDERTRSVYLWDTLLRSYAPGYLPALGRGIIRRMYGIDQRELGVLGAADRFDAQGFPQWFDRFRAFVREVPRGSHVFAHFLAPHSPYVLTDTCVVSGEFDSGYGLADRIGEGPAREGARRTYYEQYLRQARCVVSKIDALLSDLRDRPAFRDALIVIHGDHGSRISSGAFVEQLGPRDMIDNYAAFFAIRGPGIEPGTDCEFTSLPQIFRRTMAADAIPRAPLPVLVSSRAGDGVRIPTPMPVFGCAAGTGEPTP